MQIKLLKSLFFSAFILISFLTLNAQTGTLKGIITDKNNKETLPGANVAIVGTTLGASADFDGFYNIENVKPGTYSLTVSFISYNPVTINNVNIESGKTTTLNFQMEEAVISLAEANVVSYKKTNTEVALMNTIKASEMVVSGISGQQISKTQDRDASEVVKRVPGVTIVDNRFVMVRGLSERYNNVWLNNASTPSSEADVKAFSFDVIPSSMLDNLLIFKTPSAELPGDFAGGAIQVFTKNFPDKDFINISYSTAFREKSTFGNFYKTNGSKTDFLGFDNGIRKLPNDFPTRLQSISNSDYDQQKLKDFTKGLNNDWTADKTIAIPDQRLSLELAKKFKIGKITAANISSLNYSNTFSHNIVERYGFENGDSSYTYIDEQYVNSVKVGVLHNWAFNFGNNKILFRNLFNQSGQNKSILRTGEEYSNGDIIQAYEFKNTNRTTYSGQLAGEHISQNETSKLNWTLGYALAGRNEPDTKRLTLTLEQSNESPNYGKFHVLIPSGVDPKYAGRIFLLTKEKIMMISSNYSKKILFNNFEPEIKAGFYSEFKSRSFTPRILGFVAGKNYSWSQEFNPIDSIFSDNSINSDKIKLSEITNPSDAYSSENKLMAGYLSLKIPIIKKINVITGLRIEKNLQTLTSKDVEPIKIDTVNLFPSVNISYNISKKSLLRLAYGKTINRPEFREIAPFVFYDFESRAVVYGNPKLKNAIIHNYDLRFEFYPSPSEVINIGGFYKKFINPIESIMIQAGSGINYSFANAEYSTSKGVEIEARKNLSSLENQNNFLKVFKDFTVLFNASIIKSQVYFDKTIYKTEKDRAMQGQSPYIVNSGIYYTNDSLNLMISVMYNVIGKRIIFAGDPNNPDIYELPRNVLDITFKKKIGKHIQLKGGIQDILNQKVVYNQIETAENSNTTHNTMTFRPGRYYSLGITYEF